MDYLLIEEVGMKNKIKSEMRRILTRAPLIIAALLLFALPAFAQDDGAACLDCHDDVADGLVGTTHQLTNGKINGIQIECTSCHKNFKEHLEDAMEHHPSRPDTLSMLAAAQLCGSCHVTAHQTAMVSTDPHSRAELNCFSCHKIHDNKNRYLLKDDKDDYCTSCHTNVKAEFSQRSSHPLESGNIRCIDCHHQDSRKDHQLTKGFDWTCQECHTDYAGPYLYEHPVVYNHLVNGGGCTECHNPHGSPNERLLAQPGNGVCEQCHGIPPLHLTMHAGLGAKVNCVNCHTDFHGSNDNKYFLDPMLGTTFFANCYQSGCHDNVR
jgi:DmsE family decaheme c-type cytochrome